LYTFCNLEHPFRRWLHSWFNSQDLWSI